MHMIMFELVDEGSWQKRWEEEKTERRKFQILQVGVKNII